MDQEKSDDDSLDILFEPFAEGEDEDDRNMLVDHFSNIQTRLVFHFHTGDEDPLRLAEMLIAHYREGSGDFCVDGQLWFTHDDDSLPPSPLRYDRLPAWLQLIVDAYRKTEASALIDKLDRLQGIIEAAESVEADSYFNEEQNEHRSAVRRAQDSALGSRETLNEKLSFAVDILRRYAETEDGEAARNVLVFLE